MFTDTPNRGNNIGGRALQHPGASPFPPPPTEADVYAASNNAIGVSECTKPGIFGQVSNRLDGLYGRLTAIRNISAETRSRVFGPWPCGEEEARPTPSTEEQRMHAMLNIIGEIVDQIDDNVRTLGTHL